MTWQEYEKEVLETLRLYYPNATIKNNIKIKGIYSKRSRQIDIYIEDIVGGKTTTILVECKYYNKVIDVKVVESFMGMASDIGADIGLLITEKGYSKSALSRAYYDPLQIELDILSLAELKEFQGHGALPYAGENAALLLSPFGWVIDGTRRPNAICTLYQKGLTFEEAGLNKEIAYINYWDRKSNGDTLEDLIRMQEEGMRKNAANYRMKVNEIKYIDTDQRNDAKTIIRYADIDGYPAIELTGFIEFADFIFFCVWFSKKETINRNLRKLKTMLNLTLPLKTKAD